jgi:FkbM family methyltransferase
MTDFNPRQVYFTYLQQQAPNLDRQAFKKLERQLDQCNWQDPKSAWEWNNLAVAALVEAENSDHSLTRGLYVEMAFNALHSGVELGDYPLCHAHLALLYASMGDMTNAEELAFDCLIDTFQDAYTDREVPQGIIYLPTHSKTLGAMPQKEAHAEYLIEILSADNGYYQALYLLAEALCRSHAITNPQALRLMHLLAQLSPHAYTGNLKLGIHSLGMQELEGLLYLHRAQEIVPDAATALHALYLAYLEQDRIQSSDYWLKVAKDYGRQRADRRPWLWTECEDKQFTYAAFDQECVLAIEPSFNSLTTRTLLADGDWYEGEIELWRQQIQPGMTVIDVGAHSGVFAFSAAQRVGKTGRVMAIEPSGFHVACLKESVKLNGYNWVQVFAGAASDNLGKTTLYLQSPSEYHQMLGVGVEANDWQGETELVTAFKLDTFIQQAKVTKLDILKVTAVGHELQVLKGCQESIETFHPQIFYHNLFNNEPNVEVADFLSNLGYQLFRYRPYMQELLPITTSDDLVGVNKVIARFIGESDN